MAQAEKKAQQEDARIVLMDESGFSLDPAHPSTWAQKGKTPTLSVHATKRSLSMLCALVLSRHQKSFQLFSIQKKNKSFRFFDFLSFFLVLHFTLNKKLIVVLDRLSAHHKAMRILIWLLPMIGLKGKIELAFLPIYAPQLNPVEQIFGHLKNVELDNRCFDDVLQLKQAIDCALAKIRQCPKLIWAFFRHAGLIL